MANINQNPYYKANVSRFGHDMKEWLQFSTIPGILLPISYDVLSPGEKLDINDRAFIRTETLTSSAFVRIRYRLEYFFVPMPQLYSYFGSKFYGIHDYHSAALLNPRDNKLTNAYPYFSLNQLRQFLISMNEGTDSQGIPFNSGVKRLIDCFGFGTFNQSSGASNNNFMSFLPWQAYQRIFDSFYRNDLYTPTNRLSYNIDDLEESFTPDQAVTPMDSRFRDIFQIRYRNYPRDYFTNVQSSPVFNNMSVDSLFPQDSNTLFNSQIPYGMSNSGYMTRTGGQPESGSVLSNQQKVTNPVNAYSVGSYEKPNQGANPLLSVANIRNMFAMEKLLSITQRTKKTYEAQTLAHFGYDVPDQIGNKVFYIGSHDGVVTIQDVNATATTGSGENTSRLAEIAGKGIGSSVQNKNLKFTAPWHGVFMVIFSITPEVIYPNNKVTSRLSQMIRFDDFYHQEFDRLGMMPRYMYEYATSVNGEELSTDVVGFSYNYYWLKNKYDRAWGTFLSTNRNWTASRAMPTTSDISRGYIPSSFFYYSPKSLNDIMLVPFAGDVQVADESVYHQDSFMCDVDLNIKKVSSMSTYGLPQL